VSSVTSAPAFDSLIHGLHLALAVYNVGTDAYVNYCVAKLITTTGNGWALMAAVTASKQVVFMLRIIRRSGTENEGRPKYVDGLQLVRKGSHRLQTSPPVLPPEKLL